MAETDNELPMFPAPRGCPFDPPPSLKRKSGEPALRQVRTWDNATPWLVSGHAAVREVLSDTRFSSDDTIAGYPSVSPGRRATHNDQSLTRMDPPQHLLLRRKVTRYFTVKRALELQPRIQDSVDRHIDEILAKGPVVDLAAEFALPVATELICELLGVAYADRDLFMRMSGIRMSLTSAPDDVADASRQFVDYLDELLSRKEREPADDIPSELLRDYVATGQMQRQEVVRMMRLLLDAGFEATSNMIALGVLALLENPQQKQALLDRPELIEGGVEEMLRYLSITQFAARRVATADIEIAGRVIRKGEGVFAHIPSANRDADVFAEPGRLDLSREPASHLAFGFGPHSCLGQNLARVELWTAFGTLFRRIPSLALAIPLADLRFKEDVATYGLRELPVTWLTSPAE